MSSAVPAAETAGRTGPAIVVRPLAGGGALVRDYCAGVNLEPFYSGHPGDAAAYARKAAEVDERLAAADRMRVAAAIEPLGDAAPRLQRILSGDGYFVTTGQQPALFGGPLYTLFKVLAAIRLADALETLLGRPCLALFWIGADDHDWDEANHAGVIGSDDYAHRIQVQADPTLPPVPMSVRTWGAGVSRAVEDLIAHLPNGPWSREVAAHVRQTYTADATVAASFTATMRWLLQGRRVALVDSAHPLVRRAAAPVLRHDAAQVVEHGALVARQTARLEAAGYHAQVAVDADASNLMLIDEQGRDRLVRTTTGWRTRRERRSFDDAALQALLAAEPERFSPNVFLRPIVENAIFPTIAYVAGPAEVSYFAQIGCLFGGHGILPPVVVPRRSVLLLEPHIERVLERLALDADAFRQPLEQLMGEMARRRMPADVRAALEQSRASLLRTYAELADAAATIDVTLRGPVIAARNAALQRLQHAETKIVRQLKRQEGVMADQLRRAAAHVQPGGVPQERVLTPLQFAARHGPGFVAAVEEALDMTPAPVARWNGPRCE